MVNTVPRSCRSRKSIYSVSTRSLSVSSRPSISCLRNRTRYTAKRSPPESRGRCHATGSPANSPKRGCQANHPFCLPARLSSPSRTKADEGCLKGPEHRFRAAGNFCRTIWTSNLSSWDWQKAYQRSGSKRVFHFENDLAGNSYLCG